MIKSSFSKLKSRLFQIDSKTIYLYSLAVGLVTGSVAILFHHLIDFLKHFLIEDLAKFPLNQMTDLPFYPSSWNQLLILIIPTIGGLLVGLIIHYIDKNAHGSGIDYYLDSFHHGQGVVKKRTFLTKFLAASITLSTGGSAGREGPMTLIGAGIGSLFGKFIEMGARARRTLMLAGSAGGLGAIFRTPLGGAITTVEVLYKEDFETDALLACIISSVTSYTLYSSFIGFGHHLQYDASISHSPAELLLFVVLGVICAYAGLGFIKIFKKTTIFFKDHLKLNSILKPALGGLILGIIALFFPQVAGEGMDLLQWILELNISEVSVYLIFVLIGLAILKMIATSLTIGSGGSGGILAPSLFIGGMLGGSFGITFHYLFPELVPDISPYIIVGMAGFFASVTNAQLGVLIMVTEMTGGYELLPPLMIVCVISIILTKKWSIYSNQPTNKFHSKAHTWDLKPKTLQNVKIRDIKSLKTISPAIIHENINLNQIEKVAHHTYQTDFIIVNQENQFQGIFSLQDQEYNVNKENLDDLGKAILACDLSYRKNFFIGLDHTLFDALQLLIEDDFDKIPVVDENKKLLGFLTHPDITRYYHQVVNQK
jgi:CIC family chloride channel protein